MSLFGVVGARVSAEQDGFDIQGIRRRRTLNLHGRARYVTFLEGRYVSPVSIVPKVLKYRFRSAFSAEPLTTGKTGQLKVVILWLLPLLTPSASQAQSIRKSSIAINNGRIERSLQFRHSGTSTALFRPTKRLWHLSIRISRGPSTTAGL